MNSTGNLNQFKDPLLEGLERERLATRRRPADKETTKASSSGLLKLSLFAIALAGLTLFVYRSQLHIDQLSGELSDSRQQLSALSQNLAASQSHIDELSTGLEASNTVATRQGHELNRYKELYSDLKASQEAAGRELAVIQVEKAKQEDLENLRSETSSIKDTTSALQSQVDQAASSINRLDERSSRHDSEIQETRTALSDVENSVSSNRAEIEGIKLSLEREYYNFELPRKGSYMKVFSVSLRLTDTDMRKRQFDLDILADGKVLRKRDQPVNEPVLFYVDGIKKPYEVVVTRVDKDLAVGYLSIPKK